MVFKISTILIQEPFLPDLYDADSKGAVNYLNLAKEVLQKNDLTRMSQEERVLE